MSSESEQFLGIHETPPKKSGGTGISLRLRIILYISAWVVALLVTALSSGTDLLNLDDIMVFIMFLPLFPLGLGNENSSQGMNLILGWFFYGFHALVTLMCRRRIWFYALYAVLIGTLIFNIVGCHQILRSGKFRI